MTESDLIFAAKVDDSYQQFLKLLQEAIPTAKKIAFPFKYLNPIFYAEILWT